MLPPPRSPCSSKDIDELHQAAIGVDIHISDSQKQAGLLQRKAVDAIEQSMALR